MAGKPYPFTWEPLSEEENKARGKVYTGPATFNTSLLKSTPFDMYFPAKIHELGERIWNFVPRPDDVWINTYPKCGTTLTQELMWQLANGCETDSKASKAHIFLRVPFIEMTALNTQVMAVPAVECDDPMNMMARMTSDTVGWTEKLKSPRIIKTHMPMCMLPPNLLDVSKVIFVGRNPKDTCVSFFHHEKLLAGQGLDKDADFNEYAKMYMKGEVIYGDYWAHLKDGWQHKDNKNFKFVWYEDMRSDLEKAIREISEFTGHGVTDAQVDKLKKHLDIDAMKKNDAVNMKPPKGAVPEEVRDNFQFIRKGKVGNWKEWFNDATVKEWDKWIADNNNVNHNPDEKIPIKYEL